MFQAERWNDDSMYYSPMIVVGSPGSYINISIGDIATFNQDVNGITTTGLGKVTKFYKQVHH